MTNRKITDLYDVEFTPFDNYGVVVPGMSWHKISYNKENGGNGTYLLKKSVCKVHISEDPKKPCTNTSGVPLPTSSINISCIFIFY